MTAAEYRHALDALPYGKRLPSAVYLIDPGEAPALPALLRITVAELRRRLDVGQLFNLLKFHTASPKISFLAKVITNGQKKDRGFIIHPCEWRRGVAPDCMGTLQRNRIDSSFAPR